MGSGELLVVRNANKQVYKRFKQKAVEEEMSIGTALNEAMEQWLEAKESRKKPDPRNLLKAKPVDFGKGSENLSTTLDEILYG
jgi:hypothetical protein